MATKKQSSQTTTALASIERIEDNILIIRGQKVLLDRDLADLYGVKPIALRQQVKRNQVRFPDDFMFQLTAEEADLLVSQNVIPSKRSLGGFLPHAFNQEGVAMLSSVLRSERAVQVNIAIMRAFVRLRSILAAHKELARRLEGLEKQTKQNFDVVFKLISQIVEEEAKPKRKIGFETKAK